MVELEASDITPSINQTTGVITFSVDYFTPLGDYVATITCGEAEPKEVTITVTAPTVTELSYSGAGIRITALNRNYSVTISRLPMFSKGTITYGLSGYDEHFAIARSAEESFDSRTGTYQDKFTIKQISATQATEDITFNFACGDATVSVPITPYN